METYFEVTNSETAGCRSSKQWPDIPDDLFFWAE
jgi:hypothetical protein